MHYKCMLSDTVLRDCVQIKLYTDIIFKYADGDALLYFSF